MRGIEIWSGDKWKNIFALNYGYLVHKVPVSIKSTIITIWKSCQLLLTFLKARLWKLKKYNENNFSLLKKSNFQVQYLTIQFTLVIQTKNWSEQIDTLKHPLKEIQVRPCMTNFLQFKFKKKLCRFFDSPITKLLIIGRNFSILR